MALSILCHTSHSWSYVRLCQYYVILLIPGGMYGSVGIMSYFLLFMTDASSLTFPGTKYDPCVVFVFTVLSIFLSFRHFLSYILHNFLTIIL